MEPISALTQIEVNWLQPRAMKKNFELRSGERLFATVEFPSQWKLKAYATTAEGSWVIDQKGVFQVETHICENEQSQPVGIFKLRWTGTTGTLETADGRTYRWKTANFWGTKFVWEEQEGCSLVQYQTGVSSGGIGSFFKTQARMMVAAEARASRHLAMLVPLGWYLMIRHQENAAAATT